MSIRLQVTLLPIAVGFWRSIFTVKLDAMLMMLCIGREINAEHLRRRKFLIDRSQAMFFHHKGDLDQLMAARQAESLEGPPTRGMNLCGKN